MSQTLEEILENEKPEVVSQAERWATDMLSEEEQELLDAYEAGEFVSVMTPERRAFLQQCAAYTKEISSTE